MKLIVANKKILLTIAMNAAAPKQGAPTADQ
jgi:hypothetical protein